MASEVWLDVSKYQGDPDWAKVKAAGVTGVVINCDEPTFLQEVQEAAAAGLLVASYHYTQTGQGDAAAAAQHHLDAIATVRHLIAFAAGDHEAGQGDCTVWCRTYQGKLADSFGAALSYFYSGGWWIRQHISASAGDLRQYPLWDAAYGSSEPGPPPPWAQIAMWQHTSSASVPGVDGPVDESYLYQLMQHGGSTHVKLNKPVVAFRRTPSGAGYAMVTQDGGYFPFGDAPTGLGSEGGQHLNADIVDFDLTPSGKGYWMAAADGGVFTFGDAGGHGSIPGL